MLEKDIAHDTTEHNLNDKAFDEHLYHNLSETLSLQAYEYLDGDLKYRNEQKESFISGEIRNPILDYPRLNSIELTKLDSVLLDAKKDLIANEKNDVIKQAYRWRINEKLAEIRMLESVESGDMRRFKRYNEFIYGKPSKEIFAYTVNSIADSAIEALSSDNPDLANAAKELLEVLPIADQPSFIELPDDQTRQQAREQTLSDIGGLINIPEQTAEFSANQIKEEFGYAIDKVGAQGWQIVVDDKSSRSSISVSHEAQTVFIPEARKVTRTKLVGLVAHEIGTHVLRRANGERSHLMLLGTGLDRYDAGEEGITTMREQVLDDDFEDFSGLNNFLPICLALGLDGKPRDFRDVYEIMRKYCIFKKVATKDLAKAVGLAEDTAWRTCVRTFRGTDCETPGTCFTKDMIYRQGNIGIWNLIKTNPHEMLRFNVGKYDPTNERHIWILEQLGISDQDIEDLDSPNSLA